MSIPTDSLAPALLALLLAGCSGDPNESPADGSAGVGSGEAGVALMTGAADQLGAAGSEMKANPGGQASQGGSGMGGADMGQSGAGNMAGSAGTTSMEAEPLGPLSVREGCPEIKVTPYRGQAWAIVALNLIEARMVIQNVSGVNQELTTLHQWCSFPKYERLLPLDVDDAGNLQTRSFEPGEILWVNLVEGDNAAGDDAIFIRFDRSGGEIALYEAPGTYRDFDRIMAYMSWDEGNPTEGREAVAAGALIWSYSDRIELDPRWGGIVATGDTRLSEGYTSVPLACLPQRPQ